MARTSAAYSDQEKHDLMVKVCEHIAAGDLVRVAAEKENISHITVWKWANANESLGKLYARAKTEAADALADEALDVARNASNENAQAARLLVDTLKWAAAKRRPKEYGEKVDVTSGGEKIVAAVIALPTEEAPNAVSE